MKNRMKGLFLAVTAMALAGCSGAALESPEKITEGSAEEYVQAAQQMLEETDSFAAEFKVVVSMDEGSKTTTEGRVLVVADPLYMQVDAVMDLDGEEREYDVYLEETDGMINQYMNYDGEWTEMTMEEDAALINVQIYHALYNLEAILSAAENWTMEDSGSEMKLTGSIPEDRFYDLEEYARWFQLAGMAGLSEVYFAGVGDVPVTVILDDKTGAPLSYEIELAQALETVTNNVLAELGGGELENGVTIKKYSISSELTQLGGVEAGEIPAEAKSSAINYEKEISMLESE